MIISCFCPAELSVIREFCFLCNLFILFTFNYLKLYNYEDIEMVIWKTN